jgi:hypothetical protein
MSTPGRPKGELLSAGSARGSPMSPPGRPKVEPLGAGGARVVQ